MGEIRMYSEVRTDYDCEVTGLPAERWGEAVFKIGDEEVVLEISVEKDVIVAIMISEDTMNKCRFSTTSLRYLFNSLCDNSIYFFAL